MEPTVDLYKSGSSAAISNYNTSLTEMLPPRSAKLLGLRGPAFPALSLDLSAELAQENAQRRTMHKTILERDPSAFRKKERAESASSAVHQRQLMKNLLGDMHQLKDFRDIDKTKKFTRSILYEQDQQQSQTLREYQFQTLKPIEDFVRPNDQLTPRVTGYEHGHIRSLLKLDVYGPAASATIERERDAGLLPRSPNVDRHQILNPQHTMNRTRPNTGQSAFSSRPSTTGSGCNSYNGAFPSLKGLRREMDRSVDSHGRLEHPDRTRNGISPTFGASTSLQSNNNISLDHHSGAALRGSRRSNPGSDHGRALTGSRPLSQNNVLDTNGAVAEFSGLGLRPTTSSTPGTTARTNGFGSRPNTGASSVRSRSRRGEVVEHTFQGVAIGEDERLQGGDPFLRRKMWYKEFATTKKHDTEDREAYKAERQHAKQQKKIAEEERQRMKDFEDYLVLAKYNP